MEEAIRNLLEKECKWIEIGLSNGDTFNMDAPNQTEDGQIEFLDNGIIMWKIIYTDGCVSEHYFKISDIIFATGLYGCPTATEEEDIDV